MRLLVGLASLVVLTSGCDALFGPPDFAVTLSGDVETAYEGDGLMSVGIGVIGDSSILRLGNPTPGRFMLIATFPVNSDIFPPPDGAVAVGQPSGSVSAILIEPSLGVRDLSLEGTFTTQCRDSRLTGSFSLASAEEGVDLEAAGTFDVPRYNADQYPCG